MGDEKREIHVFHTAMKPIHATIHFQVFLVQKNYEFPQKRPLERRLAAGSAFYSLTEKRMGLKLNIFTV